MAEKGVKRKLVVNLAAEVEGYTRLMGADEEATLKTLDSYRKGIGGMVAENMESEALAVLVVNRVRGGLKAAAVKSRGVGLGHRGVRFARQHSRPQLSKLCRAVAIAVVLLGLNATMAAADAAATANEIHRTAEDVLSGADYQRELPRARGDPSPERNGAPRRPRPEDGAPDDTTREVPRGPGDKLEAPGALGDVGRFLLWVLVFAGGALLVFYLLNELPLLAKRARDGRHQGTSPEAHLANEESAGPGDGGSLEEIDRLARQGDYGEAVHELLQRSLENLRRRLDPALWPSLTSREIMGRVSLTEGGKSALGLIVTAAELSHFGGRAPSEPEYRACRENFQCLAVDSGGAF